MNIVIVSNIANGIGLQRDCELLSDWLCARGNRVCLQQYDAPAPKQGQLHAEVRYDLGIFIETISEHLVPMAPRWWYIANPEWLKPQFIRPIQRHCSRVLAKTRDAEKILRERFSSVVYTGFLCADKRDLAIQRIPECLHVGGNSGHRGTSAVIAAWREYRYWDNSTLPPLTVISNSRTVEPLTDVPGITFIKRATDEQVNELQNRCLFHIQPSAYEGFGQAIHESQSVGAILLTTQAAPMTELHAPFEIPAASQSKACLATLAHVTPLEIREAIPRMAALPNYEMARMQIEARLRFEQSNDAFTDRMERLLATDSEGTTLTSPTSRKEKPEPTSGRVSPLVSPRSGAISPVRIAMLGNFGPPHSTENDLAWTLRDMGHTVIQFQENEDTTEEILSGSVGCKLFLYIHTHGWTTPGRMTLDELIERLRSNGTITASFHLDRYWGLNANDQREDRVGQHSFWHTEYVFTADGGNQQRFAERNINHVWLPPGVVPMECVLGQRQKDLEIDVGFVGAESYHPEYPFRGQLLEFLRATYGPRFRVFNGYRGQSLNDLYASIRVVVGDSCFGGADFYWSDRVPETIGRGGFLIHPVTRGLCIPGLVTFEPGNLLELQDRIDYYLAHESEREHLRCAAHKWVAANETYSNRMTTLLQKVGLQ